jgi:hypothetical protein
MKVVVDTSVWSLALRRSNPDPQSRVVAELERLIREYQVAMLGPVRQELLSGVRDPAQFDRLRVKLGAFPDMALVAEDFETAAQFFNTCRAVGIQGSNTDFLICAAAFRRNLSIFTLDQDFSRFREHVGIVLHEAA